MDRWVTSILGGVVGLGVVTDGIGVVGGANKKKKKHNLEDILE